MHLCIIVKVIVICWVYIKDYVLIWESYHVMFNKELCLYEIDTDLKKYVFCPDGLIGSEPDFGGK